jgi:hypothetical protein
VRKYGWDNFTYGVIVEYDTCIANEQEICHAGQVWYFIIMDTVEELVEKDLVDLSIRRNEKETEYSSKKHEVIHQVIKVILQKKKEKQKVEGIGKYASKNKRKKKRVYEDKGEKSTII